MKSCSILTRRTGMTPQAFRAYYEDVHAPLACRFHPFRRYIRNHLIDASRPVDFDVVMEAWFDDGVNPATAISPEARALMDRDMLNFMQPERVRAARVEERVLWGERPNPTPRGAYRQMVLLEGDFAQAGTLEDVVRWGKQLGSRRGAAYASIDIAENGPGLRGTFPCQAILSLRLGRAQAEGFADVPDGVKVHAWLLAEVCETDGASLLQGA